VRTVRWLCELASVNDYDRMVHVVALALGAGRHSGIHPDENEQLQVSGSLRFTTSVLPVVASSSRGVR
jgi:hypothetical protein